MGEEIKPERLQKMLKRIIILEKEYSQTKEGSDNEIINKIKKILT